MAQNTDSWPTFAEAAEQLNASLRTMWRYNARGQLEVQKRPQPGRKPVNVVNPRDLEKLKPAPYVVAPENMHLAVHQNAAQAPAPRTGSQPGLEAILSIFTDRLKAVTIDTKDTVRISEKPILKLTEVHALTGIPIERLRQAITDGRLKARLDSEWGRGYRVRRGDLDAFIAGT
jgi:hypothetical protein